LTPLATARRLAAKYGHKLDPVIYTQGVAIDARLSLAALDGTEAQTAREVVPVVERWADGSRQPFADQAAGAELSGVTWAADLARITGDPRYRALLTAAVGRFRDRGPGLAPAPCDPDYRVEDYYFAGAVLGRAYRTTGEAMYASLLAAFLASAPEGPGDGLFWHSKTAPWRWGRGNGFAAMGFCEALTYLPESVPVRKQLLARHRRHIEALYRHQAVSGLFRQVIDVPESYEELSATCMIGYAVARGVSQGWLEPRLAVIAERAWEGAATRIGEDGSVRDVCVGTGVQPDLQSYLDRPVASGFDDRGGAMALVFAVEYAKLAGR
jgi:rhamnogalacturonyl hydrolase YesR